jgi:hypothetical protein
MHLWNDYEGKTIAGRYVLGPLLRPEGRSALFTLPAEEQPSILRLTESINDEGQMLACWRRVQELDNPSLLALKHFGDTVCEGTPLTYAVMEAPDLTLADLLKERPMTTAEALQVAQSVVPALQAIHAAELVHEHLDAANIVAIGETVKLRADCVRACRIDADLVTAQDCIDMRQRDAEQLALLFLRALTLEKKLRPGLRLPAPFDRIIPNALNGMWSLPEIAAALPMPIAPPVEKPAAAARVPAPTPAASSAAHPVTPAANAVGAAARPVAPGGTATPSIPSKIATPAPVQTAAAAISLPPTDESKVVDPPLMFQRRIQTPVRQSHSNRPLLAGLAVAAVVLFAILLHVFRSSSSGTSPQPVASAPAIPAAQPTVAHRGPRTVAATRSTPPIAQAAAAHVAAPASGPSAAVPVAAQVQPGWYVIAYTFNHEQQALQRAEAIVKRYPSLHPQVIAPHGREFLIALGGAMSRDEAESIRAVARRAGMPRDTFVRNYGS